MKQFDVIVLGGGPGGYVAAIRAAQKGLKTALIEKEKVGGMCLNWGCIPSKTLIQSAKYLQIMRKADSLGIAGIDPKKVMPDWAKMNKRTSKIVKKLTRGVEILLEKNNVTLIQAFGKIEDRHTLVVNNEALTFTDLILATGSKYIVPEFAKSIPNFYTPKNIYSIEKLPKTMTIIGGGVIGIEFALLFSSLDVQVTLIEKEKQLMPYLDLDMRRTLELSLKQNKVKILMGFDATGFDDGLILKDSEGISQKLESDIYLSAVERKANLGGLENLINEGLSLKNGFIQTDLRGRTSFPNIYAVGDVNGQVMLAHVASAEGTTAVDTILGKGRDLVYDMMPYNLYGKLEFSSVGLTEEEALKRGYITASGKFSFMANGKALAEENTGGFVKVIYDKQYGEILGVHIVSENATDLISEAALAMKSESTIWDLALTTHPHPTLSEAILEATFKALDEPLHTL